MFAHSKVLRCHVLTNSSVLSCLRRLAADGDVSRRSGTADCSRSLDPRRRNREAHARRAKRVRGTTRSQRTAERRSNFNGQYSKTTRASPCQYMLNRSIFCHSRRRWSCGRSENRKLVRRIQSSSRISTSEIPGRRNSRHLRELEHPPNSPHTHTRTKNQSVSYALSGYHRFHLHLY